MLSFHNDPAIKEKYLKRVIAHREADKIVQGIGWIKGKGCAVGCTLESYDHARYPIELGIPVWLAHLEDGIFENLEKEEAILWPERFLQAIPVGVDLEPIKDKLAIRRIDRLLIIQKDLLEKNAPLKSVINNVINSLELTKKFHENALDKKYCDWDSATFESMGASALARKAVISLGWEARLAEELMKSRLDEWSERSAAGSAMKATKSAMTVESARSLEYAAKEAAGSAMAAEYAEGYLARSEMKIITSAGSEAYLASYKKEAEDLIELLNELS